MISLRSRALAGGLLVGVAWLLSPGAVPVYDGVGAPDEPYRYVSRPSGVAVTPAPTTATGTTPVADGRGTNGLSVATSEVGPQLSLYLPPQAMASTGKSITVDVEPQAPKDAPAGARIDGNVYVVSMTADDGGPVTLTDKAAVSTIYLRATTARQPPPVVEHRASSTEPWTALQTSRGGTDFYVAAFPGPGEFAIAFTAGGDGGGSSRTPLYLGLGALALLVVVVLVVRLRATPE